MHQHDIAKTDIIRFDRDRKWDYELVAPERFVAPCNDEVKAELIRLYAEYAGGMLYDNPTLCLENISPVENFKRMISLTVGSFYDFLLCNIIGREASEGVSTRILREFRAYGASDAACKTVQKLGRAFHSHQDGIGDFSQLLAQRDLPNAIAVSILVHDKQGNYLLSTRTNNVIIAKNLGGVTATGTLEPADLMTIDGETGFEDPFCACASRELQEETGLLFSADSFRFNGLVTGKTKLQPAALVDVTSTSPLTRFFDLDQVGGAKDEKELVRVVAISQSRLERMLATHDMTEIAQYHIAQHLT